MTKLLHDVQNLSWGAWIATIALMQGLGAYLDEYYIGTTVRNKVRATIVKFLAPFKDSWNTVKDMARELPMLAEVLLWGLVPAATLYFGRMLPPDPHGILKSVLAIVFSFVFFYCLFSVIFLIPVVYIFALFIGLLTFNVCRFLIWVMFKPAADPQRSPFKFAFGMLGLWILFAKLALEIVKSRTAH